MSIKLNNLLMTALVLFMCACEQQTRTEIEAIKSFKEVNFDNISPGSLVIFDVDETLTQPEDSYLINEHTPQGEIFRQKLFQKHPDEKYLDDMASIMLIEAKRPLIEPFIIHKINQLKEKNIFVIACTNMNTGVYGTLSLLEAWRYEHLKSLGFEGSFSTLVFKLNSFRRHPVFYKGMLAADLEPKGPVIGAFLDELKLIPQKIIMFDDTYDYLLSVQKECEKRGINFQGYHYKGAKTKPWNEKVIQFQADWLIKYKEWLSDEKILTIRAKESSS